MDRLFPLVGLLALLLALVAAAGTAEPAQAEGNLPKQDAQGVFEQQVVFPEYPTDEQDAYLCSAIALPDKPLKLVGIESTSDQRIVHHMLLFGCDQPAQAEAVWNCKMRSACGAGSEAVLYGWGKNAAPIHLPDGAGFSVGKGTSIRTVVLQMHYLNGRPANDTSGIKLRFSTQPVPYSAGMIAYASGFSIPPRKPSTLVPNSCCYSGWEPLHGFATRVHTHALGRQVYLEVSSAADRTSPDRVVSLDPQKPQGFYPVKPVATFVNGDDLAMACDFNSTGMDHVVGAGHTSSDEMCNLYLMLYSQLPFFMWCLDSNPWAELSGPGGVPPNGRLVLEGGVWHEPQGLGQVSGLASPGDGTVWVFHRGDRAFDGTTFKADNTLADATPIQSSAGGAALMLQVEQDSGKVLRSWGGDSMFYMPHMVTVDYEGNLWVTDVGLHQALKFTPDGKPLMALGTPLQPGNDATHFCKPTRVAVGRDGALFVSDGYCNSRVAQFAANGTWVRDFELPLGSLSLPHSVLVHECRRQLIVAEREGGKVHAFDVDTGAYVGAWNLLEKHGLPFDVTLGPYGSVLVLSWQRDAPPNRVWVVALGPDPGQFAGQYLVSGIDFPHNLALTPAPLQVSGAGERKLAVLVSDIHESGPKLKKFVFNAAIDAARTVVVASDNGPVEEGKQPEKVAVQGEKELEKPSGVHASHIGNVELKPMDGGGAKKPAAKLAKPQPEAEAVAAPLAAPQHEKHEVARGEEDAMVEKVLDSVDSMPAVQQSVEQQQPEQQQPEQQQPEQEQPVQPKVKVKEKPLPAPAEPEQQPGGGEEAKEADDYTPEQSQDSAAGAATGMQQVEKERPQQPASPAVPEQQQQPESGAGGGASGEEEEDYTPDEAQGSSTEAQQQQQPRQVEPKAVEDQEQPQQQQQQSQEMEVEEQSVPPTNRPIIKATRSFVQPWVLGAVFVAVAVLTWTRVAVWRSHRGAGYRSAAHSHV